jgi:DNA-binding CsgD family transcriptional regulator
MSASLTRQEYEVLRLIKFGNTLPEVADETGASYYNVRTIARRLARQGLVKRNGRGEPFTVEVDLRTCRPSSR